MLLDEPTSGLDDTEIGYLANALDRIRDERAPPTGTGELIHLREQLGRDGDIGSGQGHVRLFPSVRQSVRD